MKLSREELENKVRGTLENYFSSRDKAELTHSAKVDSCSVTTWVRSYYEGWSYVIYLTY